MRCKSVTSDPVLLERLAQQLDTSSDMIVALQSEHFTSLSRQLEEGFNQGAFRLIHNSHVRQLWRQYCGPSDAYRIPTLFAAITAYLQDDLGLSGAQLESVWSATHQAMFAVALDADGDKLVGDLAGYKGFPVCACLLANAQVTIQEINLLLPSSSGSFTDDLTHAQTQMSVAELQSTFAASQAFIPLEKLAAVSMSSDGACLGTFGAEEVNLRVSAASPCDDCCCHQQMFTLSGDSMLD